MWPGYPERLAIHGSKGTAVIAGDRLVTWDARDDNGDPPPIDTAVASGASEPMAISTVPFERQFLDFAQACRSGGTPQSSGVDGRRALEFVLSIYDSCRTERPIDIAL
jgi:predicted dehydrogenase